ncbi:MAG: MarR family winged helix-turn-helix transcriptional regulator [Thermomicrobiales bacterium]
MKNDSTHPLPASPHPNPQPFDEIEHLREHHIGRLLLQAQRGFNARALQKLRERGYSDLGNTHTAVLPHIAIDGTRATVLAERAGMTKQAAGQIVADLERQGFVTRRPDPADGRAMLVCFTPEGQTYLQDAYAIKLELEAEYRELLGETRLEALRTTLDELVKHQSRQEENDHHA